MAEVVTPTEKNWGSMKRIYFDCTTHASDGTADGVSIESYDGLIVLVCTVPGTSAAEPDDNWDLVLQDADGVDLLAGQGLNRDEATTEYINSGMGGLASSKLTIGVSGAGNDKTMDVYVYIR